jgi:hypothetical protein
LPVLLLDAPTMGFTCAPLAFHLTKVPGPVGMSRGVSVDPGEGSEHDEEQDRVGA